MSLLRAPTYVIDERPIFENARESNGPVIYSAGHMIEQQTSKTDRVQWAKVIDHTRCIGCHACTTACKSENVVPIGVTRTYVKHVDVGVFPQVRRAHQVTRCNQCAHAPCVTACRLPRCSSVQTES